VASELAGGRLSAVAISGANARLDLPGCVVDIHRIGPTRWSIYRSGRGDWADLFYGLVRSRWPQLRLNRGFPLAPTGRLIKANYLMLPQSNRSPLIAFVEKSR
jgi:hypothetical protein